MSKILKLILVLVLAVAVVAPVFAQEAAPAPSVAKLTYGDKWIDLHFLFQMQGTSQYDFDEGAGENSNNGVWSKDFSVRRSRIMMNGQAAPNVTFFMETDVYTESTVTNMQRKNSLFLQDAHISYKIADALTIDVGKILVPFTHHNRQSAASLLGVDYAIKYINLALASNSIDFWRDFGAEFRGLLLDTPLGNKKGLIDYRVGVFEGSDRREVTANKYQNKNDYPRLTGRVQINLFDVEDAFYYAGTYLGKKTIVSFGGGIDYQQDVFMASNGNYKDDYFAWTADMFIDYPLAEDTAFTLQGGYINIKNDPSLVSTSHKEGYTYFVESGLLLMKAWQPVVKYMATHKEKNGAIDEDNESYVYGGLNYYINGHNANIKMEYQYPLGDEHKDISGEKKFTIQGQLFI